MLEKLGERHILVTGRLAIPMMIDHISFHSQLLTTAPPSSKPFVKSSETSGPLVRAFLLYVPVPRTIVSGEVKPFSLTDDPS
jgi:hypothetical protein